MMARDRDEAPAVCDNRDCSEPGPKSCGLVVHQRCCGGFALVAKTMCGHGAGKSPKRPPQSEFFGGRNNKKSFLIKSHCD
jgi:hypothetical protein